MTNGEHPKKPATLLCKRCKLMAWTGWSKEDIAYLVKTRKLKTLRIRPGGKLHFIVESAQQIIDSAK